jgi:hypothetical protein
MVHTTVNNEGAEIALWLVAVFILAFGYRYFRDIVGFILEKLYQFFIQNHV